MNITKETKEKTILKLHLNSDPRWANVAAMSLEEILVDHAWCEQKAASTGISLIVKHPEKTALVAAMTELVREEWEHFTRVVAELTKRGFQLGKPRKDDYVGQLLTHIRRGGSGEVQLMDTLLVSALVEARSCERFKLLWQHVADRALADFYYELMASEAGHYVTYVELAKQYADSATVEARLQELLRIEGEIVLRLPVRADRMH
ncbi:MAG: tRNA-(ms[2]io[6]A)-hydroxylase [Hymenobacteraceae bacterium]|nr:tRNA-(ms[2]io[6]A)-hydroxylase [Hymenobacteraceae bacterium]